MRTIDFADAAAHLDLDALLEQIAGLRLCVLGDLCLDIYWEADMRRSELSRETPHFPLPVVRERFSLGGAANVCANAAALGAKVQAIGVVGDDWRASALRACCDAQGIDTTSLVTDRERFTNAYCKPIRRGISDVAYEDPRLDFCTLAPMGEKTERALLEALEAAEFDVLCVSDQLPFGCVTPRVREKLTALAGAGKRILVDSRDRVGDFSGVMVKPNEVEAYAAAHGTLPPENASLNDFWDCARALRRKTGQSVFMTLGARGCAFEGEAGAFLVSAAKPPEKIDFVGAGDTMLAALGAALAAGASPEAAILFANLCASVIIGKIGMTGTASPSELRAALQRQRGEGDCHD